MTNMHFRACVLGAVFLTATQLMAASALAADRSPSAKKPFYPNVERKETELVLDRYQRPFVVERVRSEMSKFAVFHAEPQSIEKNAILVFEIQSVSKEGSVPRWRCIAVDDVAECLGRAVKIRYLPGDDKVVLHATAKPRQTAEGEALLAAAHGAAVQRSVAGR